MEFCEKLQELRKHRGLTQEELAEALYVSRTAVSKWESGRGYPSIDSLQALSRFFSVTVDDLLSGDKLLSIADRENRRNIQRILDLLFGITDLFAFLLIFLPLYPKTVGGYVYGVSLLAYTETGLLNRTAYWILFLCLTLMGGFRTVWAHRKPDSRIPFLTPCSMLLSIVCVIFLGLAGETYAVTVMFLLLLVKGSLLFKNCKTVGKI